jgi:predicted dehydrogenase/threonine dehydrogenase-like Zn-dependent dehydrogenase
MQQLTQKLRAGEMEVQEVPIPHCGPGMILVQNHFSVISAGTEGSTVKAARAGLISKAKERPQQLKQVMEVLRRSGPRQTYRTVMKKLDAYSPLGYSSAGSVVDVGENTEGFCVGDFVACAGGGYANHAEIVAIPSNLCVRLPQDADLKRASYNTMGAIALQGIRQADLRLGEACGVIGLGLIGQLTCLMLRASGVKVVGVDIDNFAVEIAGKHCADLSLNRSTPGVTEIISRFTDGLGLDAVIISAGSSSLDPVNFAGEIARKRGRIVIVGAVPTGFDREPYYYKKELELRMSCSYGPGRYDLSYEEKGIDYPAGYVRWTEKRNMEAFQNLIHSGRIDIDYLTTHEIELGDAKEAYDMIVKRSQPFLGIVIRYDTKKELQRKAVKTGGSLPLGKVRIAFVGAGSYAQGNLLPHLPKSDVDVIRSGIMTSSGTTSKRVAERFGFGFCTADEKDIFQNDEINTVFIATRHDSHADYVLKALRAGKNVFVEKPLALTEEELENIWEYFSCQRNCKTPALMVGFNRRFSPLAIELKRRLGKEPMSMIYRVNAGSIPAEHWIQDRAIGGKRIVGEACHFIDFMTYLCGAVPRSIHACALRDPQSLHDTVSINMEFADGSIGTLCYFANGSKTLEKEYIEVHQSGFTGIIRDFRELTIYGSGRRKRKRLRSQDKGQAAMMKAFLSGLKEGTGAPIPVEELLLVSFATFAAEKALKERNAIQAFSDVS